MIISLTGMDLSGTRRMIFDLSKLGTPGEITNRVLAYGGIDSFGSFRRPSMIGPTAFGSTGLGGGALGIGVPTGSVMILGVG